MLDDSQLPLFPLDVCIPVQEFRADYTIVQNNQLSFVREFILRLLDLCDMTKDQIGKFMGFTEKEIQVAIQQMINHEEIMVSHSGKFQLTAKSRGYFSSQQENRPKIQCIEDIRKGFKFDLLTFSYMKSSEYVGNANNSIRLYPPNGQASQSAKSAKTAFQRHFHQIHDEEDFSHLTIDHPELYKISSFKKLSEKYKRYTQLYGIDTVNNTVEPLVSDEFLSNVHVVPLLSEYLKDNRPANNASEIATLFDTLDYELGVSALRRESIDVANYSVKAKKAVQENLKHQPIIGSLVLNENWALFQRKLKKIPKKKNEPTKIRWIAPCDNYWSKSNEQASRFDSILQLKNVELEIYLPIPDRRDRRVRKSYISQFRNLKNSLYGFIEGFLTGFEELVIINEDCAFVVCYLYQNDDLLPIPVGFVTEDSSTVSLLAENFSTYIESLDQYFEPKGLGKLYSPRN